jgi:hypothetical protein
MGDLPPNADKLTLSSILSIPSEYVVYPAVKRSLNESSWENWQIERGGNMVSRTDAFSSPAKSDGPQCIVVDDANLGFRERRDQWPSGFIESCRQSSHIILKTSSPIHTSALLDALVKHSAPKLTVCFSVDDLRKALYPIGQPLSWERTAIEVANAVQRIDELKEVKRVVVWISLGGAILYQKGQNPVLLFDPSNQEGDWERQFPGGLERDTGSWIAACLAIECSRNSSSPNWIEGIRRGITAARCAYRSWNDLRNQLSPSRLLAVDLEDIAAKISDRSLGLDVFEAVDFPKDRDWQLLSLAFTRGYIGEPKGDRYRRSYGRISEEVVRLGSAEACRGLPIERMGRWVSLGRSEIEGIRSVRNILS